MSNEAVRKAVELVGLQPLADACGVRYQAVQRWEKKGAPAERVLDLEKATKGVVTRHELRPDLYPEAAA